MTPAALLGLALLAAAPPDDGDAVAIAPPPLIDERVVVIADDRARGRRLEAALRARGLRLVDDAERSGLDGPFARPPAGDRERLRTLLLAARGAWRQLDLDAAAGLIDEAIAEAVRLERPEDHADLLVDALLFRAALAVGRGDGDDARPDLILASRLEPAREALNAALHPPSLLEAWASARDASRAAAPRVVVVRPRVVGDDGGAEVVVDGVVVVPRDGLLELGRGPHLVTVRAPGCGSVSLILEVGDGDVAVEDVLVADAAIADREARIAALRRGERAALTGLRETLGVDVIVALDLAPDVLVQHATTPPQALDVPRDAATGALADAILRAVAPAAVSGDDDDDPPLAAVWWTVGAGGAAVVLGAAAVGVWLLWPGDVPPPPPRPLPITCCGL